MADIRTLINLTISKTPNMGNSIPASDSTVLTVSTSDVEEVHRLLALAGFTPTACSPEEVISVGLPELPNDNSEYGSEIEVEDTYDTGSEEPIELDDTEEQSPNAVIPLYDREESMDESVSHYISRLAGLGTKETLDEARLLEVHNMSEKLLNVLHRLGKNMLDAASRAGKFKGERENSEKFRELNDYSRVGELLVALGEPFSVPLEKFDRADKEFIAAKLGVPYEKFARIARLRESTKNLRPYEGDNQYKLPSKEFAKNDQDLVNNSGDNPINDKNEPRSTGVKTIRESLDAIADLKRKFKLNESASEVKYMAQTIADLPNDLIYDEIIARLFLDDVAGSHITEQSIEHALAHIDGETFNHIRNLLKSKIEEGQVIPFPSNKEWFSGNYGIELELNKDDAESGSHSGDCEEDIKELMNKPYIKAQLDKLDPEELKRELKEYGAWDENELTDHEDNLMRILWIACGDISDRQFSEVDEDFQHGDADGDNHGTELVDEHIDDMGMPYNPDEDDMQDNNHFFHNGMKVKLVGPYAGNNAHEIFTLSQWDDEKRKGWIADKDGRGWYAKDYQIEPVDDFEPEDDDYQDVDEGNAHDDLRADPSDHDTLMNKNIADARREHIVSEGRTTDAIRQEISDIEDKLGELTHRKHIDVNLVNRLVSKSIKLRAELASASPKRSNSMMMGENTIGSLKNKLNSLSEGNNTQKWVVWDPNRNNKIIKTFMNPHKAKDFAGLHNLEMNSYEYWHDNFNPNYKEYNIDKSEADLNNREQENWYDTTNEAINLKHKIQAKLLVGFNNKQVTKTFRDRADLDKWVDENDAEILSTRSLENANIIGDMVFDKSDFKESTITEKAPPGMEQWVKHNKAKFKKEYGDKKGEEVLYATAWKMAKESIENLANSLLEKFDSFK